MKVITGELLKEMILCGANTLHNNHLEIDALNVFPVPDGDTGTNMSMTFNAGAKEVKDLKSNDVYEIAKKLSKGLLMGARGNSGVILSQIFRGFAMALEGHQEIDALLLAKAWQSGAKVAYKAVMRPVEGTILTVIRESSEKVVEYAREGMEVEDVLSYFVKEAEASLERTPELLPVLKEVGVVDSGGAGLLLVLTGFMAGLQGDRVEFVDVTGGAQTNAGTNLEGKEEGFGYCTEFIIRLNPSLIEKFSEDQLKKELSLIPGESIVVVQDEDIVKVHVHTLKPGNALNIAQRFGEFVKLKIENMQEQADTLQANAGSIVGVDDNDAGVQEAKETAVIAVCAGKGIENAFLELHCDYIVSGGQTMNPSTEDMVAAVKKVNAKNVIILPNNSNIVMTAQQTATILEGEVNVIVIPTKTIPQGLSACIMFNPDASLDENIDEMKEAMSNVKTGQVTFAIKDTNIDGVEIKANDYMALVEKDIVACVDNKLDALKVCLDKLIDEDSELVTLIVGEDVNDEEVEEIESYIEDNFEAELELIEGKQPVYSFIIGVE
ncbi:DAK2 domain-containing protein [Erysipelatoclostridium sp. AM42-17]|uniref:DAK2 domain-containing protein n=1 Tax=Erysipelatoclostridium sp. AM42-17 TaxID=2293102 RepID=UPI000E4C5E63|nr:DAK2 domain-containing protein [Erysipelatoclostridium sp. AM42-17]RHS95676.1 DAK2 domain-containing protein [Erysipelatoclostridium sp. AM42-17]